MRLRRLVPLVVGLLGVVGACSSFTADPTASATDAGAETSAVDRDATGPADDAATPGDANLLASPGFEDGCGRWSFMGSRTQPSFEQIDTLVLGGAHACKVCATGDGGTIAIGQAGPRAGAAGATVAGSLWVHAKGDAGSGLVAPTVTVITSAANRDTLEFFNGAGPSVDGSWKPVTTGLAATKPFANVELRFSATAPAAGYCFVVDDAVLTVTDP